jgi:hypothetical protein
MAVKTGLHLCPEYYLLLSFIQPSDVLHAVKVEEIKMLSSNRTLEILFI